MKNYIYKNIIFAFSAFVVFVLGGLIVNKASAQSAGFCMPTSGCLKEWPWVYDLAIPTNIYNKNTGNVGIGTTTPTEKLEISGGLKVANGNPGSTGIIASGGFRGGTFSNAGSDGTANLGAVNNGIEARGSNVAGIFQNTVNTGQAYLGQGNIGILTYGSAYAGYFSGNVEAAGNLTTKNRPVTYWCAVNDHCPGVGVLCMNSDAWGNLATYPSAVWDGLVWRTGALVNPPYVACNLGVIMKAF